MMLLPNEMKKILTLIMAVTLTVICQDIYAAGRKAEESPAIQTLGSLKDAKKLEGAMLKLARPIIKKTPMSVVMDNIETMVICDMGKEGKEVDPELKAIVENVLKHYSKVDEIDDEMYHMLIYIDEPEGDRFSEIILYTTRKDKSVMVFKGDFTIDSLKKVGELSDQQRELRKRGR